MRETGDFVGETENFVGGLGDFDGDKGAFVGKRGTLFGNCSIPPPKSIDFIGKNHCFQYVPEHLPGFRLETGFLPILNGCVGGTPSGIEIHRFQ